MEQTALLALVSGLGSLSERIVDGKPVPYYQRGSEALECILDLQRFLRRDDRKTATVRRQLGQWRLAGRDLLEMLVSYREDSKFCYEVLKLLVMLTLPPPPEAHQLSELHDQLYETKERFVQRHDALTAVAYFFRLALLDGALYPTPPKSAGGGSRVAQPRRLLELLLHLVRNLLQVPEKPRSQTLGHALGDLHHRFLLRLDRVRFFGLLLTLIGYIDPNHNMLSSEQSSSSEDEDEADFADIFAESEDGAQPSTREFNKLFAEITYHILNTQPDAVALADSRPSAIIQDDNQSSLNASSLRRTLLKNPLHPSIFNAHLPLNKKKKKTAIEQPFQDDFNDEEDFDH